MEVHSMMGGTRKPDRSIYSRLSRRSKTSCLRFSFSLLSATNAPPISPFASHCAHFPLKRHDDFVATQRFQS